MTPTADQFVAELRARSTESARLGYERTLKADEHDQFLGVRMGQVFDLAKQHLDMPTPELETMLESPLHEMRVGALSIMDKAARRRSTPSDRRREHHELYLRRHDRINFWDLVDVAAPHVIGGYLYDYGQSRDVLYRLARSDSPWERRTAIVATYFFIRHGDLDDTFRISELLLDDDHHLVQKAVGSWLRETGKHDRPRLLAFLDQHAAAMPRITLRYTIEHLDPTLRTHYRSLT